MSAAFIAAECCRRLRSHTLEHIYDPALFFRKLRDVMRIGSLMVFSAPNIVELARRDQPCLHFEHTFLLREEWVDYLLAKYGFEVVAPHHPRLSPHHPRAAMRASHHAPRTTHHASRMA